MGAAVVAQIDEHLGGAAVGIFKGVGDSASRVGEAAGIVGNVLMPPGAGESRVGSDAELGPGGGADAEKGCTVVVTMADELVEAIGAVRRPFPLDLQKNISPRGGEPDMVDGGGGFLKGCRLRVEQGGGRVAGRWRYRQGHQDDGMQQVKPDGSLCRMMAHGIQMYLTVAVRVPRILSKFSQIST